MTQGRPASTGRGASDRALDVLVVAALAVAATLLRSFALPTRGTWDADQGEQMLVLLGLVRQGQVPLLGPPSSIGDFHHGALYYYLLAPGAALTDGDPVAASATLAAFGVVAVVATWWLARSVAGPMAGLVAGGVLALSATEIALSTTIWNPSLVPAGAAIAIATGWRAYSGSSPAWWVASAIGLAIAVQAHLVAGLLLGPLVGLYLVSVVRADSGGRRTLGLAGLAAIGVLGLAHAPHLIHELGTGFAQLRSIGDLAADSQSGTSLLTRLFVVPIRIVSWPLVGLFTDALVLAVAATVVVVGLVAWRIRAAGPPERAAMIWLGATLAWSWAALVVLAPSLGTVVRELPVDHYHAYLDPVVATIVGVGVSALLRGGPAGRLGAIAVVVPLLVWNVATQPPLVHPDGGWPAGEAAGERIATAAGGAPIGFVTLPDFKGPQAYRFPVERARAEVLDDPASLPDGGLLVVLCEDLFREAIGASCGGPAEAEVLDGLGRPTVLVDRFEPSPGRLLSLYRLEGPTY